MKSTIVRFKINEDDQAEAIRQGRAPQNNPAHLRVDLSELDPANRTLIADRFQDGWIYKLRSKTLKKRSEDVIVAQDASLDGLIAALLEDEENVRQMDACCGLEDARP